VEWRVTDEPALPPILVFAALALASLGIVVRALQAVHDDAPVAASAPLASPARP
jgi:hypothetical protein